MSSTKKINSFAFILKSGKILFNLQWCVSGVDSRIVLFQNGIWYPKCVKSVLTSSNSVDPLYNGRFYNKNFNFLPNFFWCILRNSYNQVTLWMDGLVGKVMLNHLERNLSVFYGTVIFITVHKIQPLICTLSRINP